MLRRPLNWTDDGAQFVCKAEVPEISDSFTRHEVTLNVLREWRTVDCAELDVEGESPVVVSGHVTVWSTRFYAC